jgi:PAS domain S-box-containing protein
VLIAGYPWNVHMPETEKSVMDRTYPRFGIAVVIVLAALLLRQMMVRYFHVELSPFITFYPAVMAVATLAGLLPGLLATLLSALLAIYWIFPPAGHFAIARTSDAVALIFFAVMGVFISWGVEHFRRNQQQIVALKREQVRESDQKLQEMSEQRRLALDAAGLGVWEYRFKTGEVFRDECCRGLYGVAEGNSIDYAAILARVHPDDRAAVDRANKQAIAGANNGMYSIEYRVVWSDGSVHWISSHGQVHFETEGGIATGFVGVSMDITARRQAEAELRSAQAKMQGIITSAMDAVISVNELQQIVVFNQAAEAVFGCPASDAIGSGVERFIPNRLREGHRAHIRRFGTEGATARSMLAPGILMALRANGEEFPIEATISKAVADGEQLFTVILRDITERKRAEDALRRQATLIDLTPDVFIVMQPDRTITYWNRGAEVLYGWTKEEAIGQRAHTLFQTKFPQPMEEIDEQLKSTGAWSGELIHRTKDGIEIIVYSRWLAQFDAQGNVTEVLESNADITARKQAEREVSELNQQLEDRVRRRTAELETANKELEAFSYSVSHDLRSPLRTMDGFSQALLEDHSEGLNEKGKHYVTRIRTAAQRMGSLIDDLLQLSRLSRTEIRVKPVDLSAIAESIVADLKTSDPERKVEVHIEPGLEVKGDPGLLEIALQNLLSNAWKFTSRRESALIEFGKLNGRPKPTFFVRDNGTGFDMQYANRLFSPFQRLHTAEEFRGTGIGLATVQRILRRHYGSTWAEAVEGQGATFYFELGI